MPERRKEESLNINRKYYVKWKRQDKPNSWKEREDSLSKPNKKEMNS